MSYRQITREERYAMALGRQAGWSIRAISRHLQRSSSSISRELRRNLEPGRRLPARHCSAEDSEPPAPGPSSLAVHGAGMGRDPATVAQAECHRIARQLNGRPRKRLDCLTPEESYAPAA